MKNLKFSAIASIMLFLGACTDLNVEERDSFAASTATGAFTGVEPAATLTAAYTDLRQWVGNDNMYGLNEVASDELLVPTRGTDWGDNGVWRTMHQHTWDATHPRVLNTWNDLHRNLFRLSQLLDSRSKANPAQIAQAKFLRAYNMYYALDMFRQIPQRGLDDAVDVAPKVLTVQQSIDQINQDLADALVGLPQVGPSVTSVSLAASKAACNFLKAKFLLNKHIYLGGTPVAADMTAVIASVDAIAADGFALQSGNYFDIFKSDPDSETILWTDESAGARIWNGLHYNQVSPDRAEGGWNGFSTYADFYAKFEGSAASNEPGNGQEMRRGFVTKDGSKLGIGFGFLVGQQYGADGSKLEDRAGNDLVFTKDFPGLSGNNERTGIRVIKYHPYNPTATAPFNNAFVSHYILFRYADAHLMKVEAILRGGSSSTPALTLYNQLRTIRGASTAAAVSLDNVFDERGRELYAEGWRRNDQIRFGKFNIPYGFMQNTQEFRSVYPIPSIAIGTNPNLKQNPGY
jgi:starch-binding outer membrane protein, SusD/RagB family